MRTLILRLSTVAITLLGWHRAQAQFVHTYKPAPVWSDEFNGSAVDRANWDFEEGFFGYNGELQTYQAANAAVANGNLMITAKREWVAPYTNPGYTSSRMVSKHLQDFRFGKVEARIKMPLNKGMWPAFWMLGSDEANWPLNGEIDIMEHVNADNLTYATEHWDNNGHVQYGTRTTIPAPADGYHIYTTEWDTDYIRTYVDGYKYHEFRISGGVGSTEEFQKRFFLLLNLAVGGEMTGYQSPNDNELPATMFVDYVRVFERTDAPVVGTAGLLLEAENADLADMHQGKTLKAEACAEGGQDIGYIQAGNFLKFNVKFPGAGTYRLDYRVASGAAGGTISADLNGGTIALGNTTIPGTGGWQNWQTVSQTITVATAGTYDLGIFAQTTGYNLNWIRLTPISTSTPPATGVATFYKDFYYGGYAVPLAVGSYTMADLQARGIPNDDISSLKVSVGYQVTLYEADNFGGNALTLTTDNNSLGNVPLGAGTWNDVTSSIRIQVATPPPASSQLLEAENANVVQGMTAEGCAEGGQDMGYVQAGGFLTFNNISFPTTGTYLVEYRVASGAGGGTVACDLNAGSIPLGTTAVPGTGGWQNWTTVSRTVNVNAGTYNFGVYAQTAGYNLNWIRISRTGATRTALATASAPARVAARYEVFPNPVIGSFSIAGLAQPSAVVVRNTIGKVVLRQHIEANESVDFKALPAGLYMVTIDTGTEQVTRKVVKE